MFENKEPPTELSAATVDLSILSDRCWSGHECELDLVEHGAVLRVRDPLDHVHGDGGQGEVAVQHALVDQVLDLLEGEELHPREHLLERVALARRLDLLVEAADGEEGHVRRAGGVVAEPAERPLLTHEHTGLLLGLAHGGLQTGLVELAEASGDLPGRATDRIEVDAAGGVVLLPGLGVERGLRAHALLQADAAPAVDGEEQGSARLRAQDAVVERLPIVVAVHHVDDPSVLAVASALEHDGAFTGTPCGALAFFEIDFDDGLELSHSVLLCSFERLGNDTPCVGRVIARIRVLVNYPNLIHNLSPLTVSSHGDRLLI